MTDAKSRALEAWESLVEEAISHEMNALNILVVDKFIRAALCQPRAVDVSRAKAAKVAMIKQMWGYYEPDLTKQEKMDINETLMAALDSFIPASSEEGV